MTPEQIQRRTDEKVGIIQEMMRQLQLTATAEDFMNSAGIIKKVIYWVDNENYPKDEVTKVPVLDKDPEKVEPVEVKTEEKNA